MKEGALDCLLCASVLSVWLACLAFARFSHALDRLHCVTFINVGAGAFITLAAFVDEGVTTRSLKIVFLTLVTLLAGAATTQVAARAIWLRSGGKL